MNRGTENEMSTGTMAGTPQVLLAHKLPTVLREYEKLARQCARYGVDHSRYLLRLIELELVDRERRTVERRILAARFPAVNSFDTFDFTAIQASTKCSCWRWRAANMFLRRENIITLGSSGTGGLPERLHGRVNDRRRPGMEARDKKRLLTMQRYDRGSTIVTSNLPFEYWTQVMGSEQLSGALLDRLTHHVSILAMNGDSYRLKQSARRLACILIARTGVDYLADSIGKAVVDLISDKATIEFTS